MWTQVLNLAFTLDFISTEYMSLRLLMQTIFYLFQDIIFKDCHFWTLAICFHHHWKNSSPFYDSGQAGFRGQYWQINNRVWSLFCDSIVFTNIYFTWWSCQPCHILVSGCSPPTNRLTVIIIFHHIMIIFQVQISKLKVNIPCDLNIVKHNYIAQLTDLYVLLSLVFAYFFLIGWISLTLFWGSQRLLFLDIFSFIFLYI